MLLDKVFLAILNSSLSAAFVIAAGVLLRLALSKAPKNITLFLWAAVGVRLAFPLFEMLSVSLPKAKFSLIPSAKTIPDGFLMSREPQIHTGISYLNSVVNPVIESSLTPNPAASANPAQIWAFIYENIWVLGICIMFAVGLYGMLAVLLKVRKATLLEDNIYSVSGISSPFVFGIIKPKIYLPENMNIEYESYVISHEKAHIKRGDHIIKLIAYIFLSVYWFSIPVWIAYVLLCRDIELACDEKVISSLDEDAKREYSTALLEVSIGAGKGMSKRISACPIAFGEVGVKKRIKGILRYKKPALAVTVLAVCVTLVFAGCFLTNPENDGERGNEEIEISTEVSGIFGTFEPVEVRHWALWSSLMLTEPPESIISVTEDSFSVTVVGNGGGIFESDHILNPVYERAGEITSIPPVINNGAISSSSLMPSLEEYSEVVEYKVLENGEDSGFRLWHLDGKELWIGRYGLYGSEKQAQWLEYVFTLGAAVPTAYWTNNPMMSATFHYALSTHFITKSPYTSVIVETDRPALCLDVNDEPSSVLEVRPGYGFYWIPYEESKIIASPVDGKIASVTAYPYYSDGIEIKYTVKNGETVLTSGKLKVENTEESLYGGNTFAVKLVSDDPTAALVMDSGLFLAFGEESERIAGLAARAPQYFRVGTFKGIEVYAWEEDGEVYCGVMSGTNRMKTEEEIEWLKASPVTLHEMRLILSTVQGLKKDEVFVFGNNTRMSAEEMLEALVGEG